MATQTTEFFPIESGIGDFDLPATGDMIDTIFNDQREGAYRQSIATHMDSVSRTWRDELRGWINGFSYANELIDGGKFDPRYIATVRADKDPDAMPFAQGFRQGEKIAIKANMPLIGVHYV